MLAPRRVTTAEHLDDAGADRASVARSLRDLRGINAGSAARSPIATSCGASRTGSDVSVLDIGTGTSDLLESIDVRRKIGADLKLDHLAYGAALARDPSIRRVAANALSLPFRDASVDVVTSSHFFHHFSDEENVEIFRESLRVARIGVCVSDTRRHWLPLIFVHALSATPLWGRITRHDAPASVRQGYTAAEAAAIAAQAGASRWTLVRQISFRFGVVLWK